MSNLYLILLIVVLTLNLVFWLTVICCRIVCNFQLDIPAGGGSACCQRLRCRRRRSESHSDRTQNREGDGQRNSGFDDQENESGNQRPYSIAATMDLPPSYEEAAKHSLYTTEHTLPYLQVASFQGPADATRITPHEQQVTLVVPEEETVHRALDTISGNENHNTSNLSLPCRNYEQHTTPLPNTVSLQPPLSPINEVDEDISLTFVIDNIGVQTARLIGASDSSTKLIDGDTLETHSKC